MKCKCCQKHLNSMYYYCSICDYNLNLTCAKRPPPLTIINLKSHDHPLTLFPRRIHLPCDACGLTLNNTHDHVYTCPPCGYMVHRTCIYLPRVIKITRHPHRLSLSSSLPPGLLPCGVCRHPINITCGQFSCQTGCEYAVHSKCAVKGRVWDGIDLEDVPEDPDEDKDIEPFVRIDDETIDHFSHQHHLRLCRNDNLCDENRFCQACTLPVIISESSFSCIPCDFLLHEACASLPRKKYHPLHKHPLILHPISFEPMDPFKHEETNYGTCFVKGLFKCNGCNQMGCGFTYKCNHINCEFQLDTRCASLPDPLNHGSHPHELFFNLTDGRCMRCKSSNCSPFSLECIKCKSFLGLKCASLPIVTHYKHDRHPLTLCFGEQDETNDQYWCEICEAKLDAEEWFYKCDDYCNVTVHISCLLGKESFVKPMSLYVHKSIQLFGEFWERLFVIPNSGNTRAKCRRCGLRCIGPFFFEEYDEIIRNWNWRYCSLLCFLRR